MAYVDTWVLNLNIDLTARQEIDFLGERPCRQRLTIDDLGWVTLRGYGRVAADMPEYLDYLTVRRVPTTELPALLAQVRELAANIPAPAVGMPTDWRLTVRSADETTSWQGSTAANELAAQVVSNWLQAKLQLIDLWPLTKSAGMQAELELTEAITDVDTFAQYYRMAFMDPASDVPFLQANFSRVAAQVGLDADNGKLFADRYGRAALTSPLVLKKRLQTIDEWQLLGGAVLLRNNRWRQGEHSALLAPELRSWFILALTRLQELVAPADSADRQQREFARLTYKAEDAQTFLAPPNFAKQEVVIDAAGLISYTRYYYGDFMDRAQHQPQLLLEKQTVVAQPQQLFAAMRRLPEFGAQQFSVRDSGTWTLTLVDGMEARKLAGFLSDNLPPAFQHFSQLLQKMVRIPEFMDLTGGARHWPDLQKVAGKQPEPLATFTLSLQDSTQTVKERLVLDAAAGSYVYQQKQGSRTVATRVQDAAAVVALLQDIARYNLVIDEAATSPELTPQEFMTNAGTYELNVLYASGLEITTTAPYRRDSLPLAWDQVMYAIAQFTAETGQGALLNPNRFLRGKRSGELIYLSVTFTEDGQEYNYQADADIFQVGDRVLVPVGSDDRQTAVTITNVAYYMPGEEPYPAAKTKRVLGFATADDEGDAAD
jgi:hypothetical protein